MSEVVWDYEMGISINDSIYVEGADSIFSGV